MKFKTKPIEIQAWKWDCGEPIPDWVLKAEKKNIIAFNDPTNATKFCSGKIWNGLHSSWIYFGLESWIINGGGEDIYPCHETVFQKKYERI